MIKAKEAKSMTISSRLDGRILDKISQAIITAASKGEYSADISPIMATVLKVPYVDYLEDLGYSISNLENGNHGTYVEWY